MATLREINRIVVHCSATRPSMDIGADEIRQWHLDKGWADIGYHWVIRRNGDLQAGRDLDGDGDIMEEVGAHALGYNAQSLGICLVGGVDNAGAPDANFTIFQYAKLYQWLFELKQEFPNAVICGHRELSTKACPSFDVRAFLQFTPLAEVSHGQ